MCLTFVFISTRPGMETWTRSGSSSMLWCHLTKSELSEENKIDCIGDINAILFQLDELFKHEFLSLAHLHHLPHLTTFANSPSITSPFLISLPKIFHSLLPISSLYILTNWYLRPPPHSRCLPLPSLPSRHLPFLPLFPLRLGYLCFPKCQFSFSGCQRLPRLLHGLNIYRIHFSHLDGLSLGEKDAIEGGLKQIIQGDVYWQKDWLFGN